MFGFFKSLSSQSTALKDLGILIIRIGIGTLIMRNGINLISGGSEQWASLGMSMANIGITFLPVFWGFCAALSQALGGLMIMIGFGTRPAACILTFVMLIAFIMHIANGDSWNITAHPLVFLIVFLGLTIAGSGRLSVEYLLFGE